MVGNVNGELTEKQKRFADFYIETGNATESYLKAGYKVNANVAKVNACRTLTKANVKAYISEKMSKKDKERIASQDEVLEYFTRVMRGESESEVVVIEGCGDGVSEARRMLKAPDEKERLIAAKELAKRYGIDKAQDKEFDSIVKVVW